MRSKLIKYSQLGKKNIQIMVFDTLTKHETYMKNGCKHKRNKNEKIKTKCINGVCCAAMLLLQSKIEKKTEIEELRK